MGEHRCNTDTAAALLYSSIVIAYAGCTFLCKEAKGKIAAMKHSLRDHPGYINTDTHVIWTQQFFKAGLEEEEVASQDVKKLVSVL